MCDEPPAPKRPGRLKYAEQRELESLPERIETLEARLAELHEKMAAPEFYQQDRAAIVRANEEHEALRDELAGAYARWEELESRRG